MCASHEFAGMRVDKPLAFVRMNRSVSYCYICFTMIWTSEWNLHCQIHLDEVWHKVMQFGYNSVYVRFRYEWPGICPFCLEQGLVTQHNGHQLISHIHHMHLNKLESDGALSKCPCGDLDKLMSWNDLHDHMIDSHDIQLAAETVEKSVSTLLEPPPEDVEVVDTVDDLTTLPDVAPPPLELEPLYFPAEAVFGTEEFPNSPVRIYRMQIRNIGGTHPTPSQILPRYSDVEIQLQGVDESFAPPTSKGPKSHRPSLVIDNPWLGRDGKLAVNLVFESCT